MDETNKHGIKVHRYETCHYGHTDKDGRWHNAVIYVPECCFSCKELDDGEYGEYGDLWVPPSCILGVWMPTKKGECKKRNLVKR